VFLIRNSGFSLVRKKRKSHPIEVYPYHAPFHTKHLIQEPFKLDDF